MTRLTDTEYKNLFAEIESADTLDLDKLNALSYERSARSYEALGGKRSRQSVQNRRFIVLIPSLDKKHGCKLVGRTQEDGSVQYERHATGYSAYAWAR